MFKLISLQTYKLLIFNSQNHNVFYVLLLMLMKNNSINSLDLILINDIKKTIYVGNF